jgi:hypothetical protein
MLSLLEYRWKPDGSQKRLSQSRIIDAGTVSSKNTIPLTVFDHDNGAAKLLARSPKEVKCRRRPLPAERIELLRHGEHG